MQQWLVFDFRRILTLFPQLARAVPLPRNRHTRMLIKLGSRVVSSATSDWGDQWPAPVISILTRERRIEIIGEAALTAAASSVNSQQDRKKAGRPIKIWIRVRIVTTIQQKSTSQQRGCSSGNCLTDSGD